MYKTRHKSIDFRDNRRFNIKININDVMFSGRNTVLNVSTFILAKVSECSCFIEFIKRVGKRI